MELGVRGVLATGPLSLRNLIPKEDEVGGSIDRSFWTRGVDIVDRGCCAIVAVVIVIGDRGAGRRRSARRAGLASTIDSRGVIRDMR